jgi:hypothetical protein
MNRRILVIVASIVVVLGLIVGAYYLFFSDGATLSVGEPGDLFGTSGDRPVSELLGPDGAPIQGAGTVVAPKLIRISDAPVAKGTIALFIPAVEPEASSTALATPADTEVRFIERQSGNVYAFRLHDRVLTRISNRTIPGIQEAVWTADGARAFVRYLTRAADGTEHVDTYALPASGGEGYFLEQGLEQVAVQGTSTVFSLLPNTSGSIGSLSNPDGTNIRTLFTSALSRLNARFSGSDVVVTTKASSALDGYAFLVSRATGSFTRILGPLRGLSTLASPGGESVLYSYADKGRVYLQVLDLPTMTATALPLSTFADKCAWAPGGRAVYCGVPTALAGNMPDDWYQGAATFSDRIWRIDLDTRLATLVVDPSQVADVAIDAVALTLDPISDTLIFTNKKDGSLWAYDL